MLSTFVDHLGGAAAQAITLGGVAMGGGATVSLALAASLAAIAVILVAVSRRSFARWPRGFLITLMVAMAGAGLAIAVVFGVWAYVEHRDGLVRQIVTELTHIADIQQNEIKEDLRDAQTQLQFFATRLTDEARRNPVIVGERLRELQAFDPRFLQVSLMDAEGRILVSTSTACSTSSSATACWPSSARSTRARGTSAGPSSLDCA